LLTSDATIDVISTGLYIQYFGRRGHFKMAAIRKYVRLFKKGYSPDRSPCLDK